MTDTTARDLIQRLANELDHYRQLLMDDRRETHALANEARAYLASKSDGSAVPDGREPTSVIQQLNHQLHRRATILLIRKVIDQAIRDTASVQWRVADTGEQLVRASDLVAWAEQMEQQMEQLND
jgi:hypothetical protein